MPGIFNSKKMRTVLLTLLLCSSATLMAQKHQVRNWKESPNNPLAYYYNTNHFGLFGKIKSIEESSPETKKFSFYRFDESGLLLQVTDSTNLIKDDYIYSYKSPKSVVENHTATSSAGKQISTTMAFRNNDGIIDEIQMDYGKITKKYLTYNKKGQIEKSDDGKEVQKFKYNPKGQLISEETEYEGTVSYKSSYQYNQKANGLEVVISTEDSYTKTRSTFTQQYNLNGQLLTETELSGDWEIKKTYELDEKGNWTRETKVYRNLKNNSSYTNTRLRKIVYYP